MSRARMIWGSVFVLAAAALLAVPHPGNSQNAAADASPVKKDRPPLNAFMRAKLGASQDILDGLVTEDFAKITKGTLRLQAITVAEEWKLSDDQAWLDQSAEFRRVLGRLKASSANKNLDASALNYMEMTISCIRCHKEFRKPADSERKASE
ncbi:MAG: hypothetical protein IT428_31355 [Planctomycetaceae bacterium]|nr:hypothetical protein [Planctomycetaceae bacterium]